MERPAPVPLALPLRQALLMLEGLRKQVAGVLDTALASENLTLAEWLIVSELVAGEASLSRIACRLSRDAGSLSRAISRLAGRRLLGSHREGRDRRCATLRLTPAGYALHVRMADVIERAALMDRTDLASRMGRLISLLGPLAGIPEADASTL
jgi:DNA-binding MarR family transcriptional regulator